MSTAPLPYLERMQHSPAEILLAFLDDLLERQRSLELIQGEDPSLVYARAALRVYLLRPGLDALPPQVAVLGPTQAGKSTLTNLLAGAAVAGVSALAGHTRHLQGFTDVAALPPLAGDLARLLPEYRCVTAAQLHDSDLQTFSLSRIDSPLIGPTRGMVLWDSPDFDSSSSRSYRAAVPNLAALADVVVLVVSKEKYADQSVWQTLHLLAELPRPLVICINKTDPASAARVCTAMAEKFTAAGIDHGGIFSLDYHSHADLAALNHERTADLVRTRLRALLEALPVTIDNTALKHMLLRHWPSWTADLRHEIAAAAHWQEQVALALDGVETHYRSDYLTAADYAQTTRRAQARLLELLEIPGLSRYLTQVRALLARPLRSLLSHLGRQADGRPPNREVEVLNAATAQCLTHLVRIGGDLALADDERASTWWRALRHRLHETQAGLEQAVSTDALAHQAAFSPIIDAAAEKLYKYLQAHPVTLNGLRAARVSTEAAAVVLAVKTAGLGVSDLLVAPAMISFTSMLTEGALGGYLRQVENELKQAQIDAVRVQVLEPLRQSLLALPRQMTAAGLYGIPGERLAAADKALQEWQDG